MLYDLIDFSSVISNSQKISALSTGNVRKIPNNSPLRQEVRISG
jgi:hypothetical protein